MKKFIKNILWNLLRKKNGLNVVKVLSGQAKGIKLLLDIRVGGAYFIGVYDKWIFNRIDFKNFIKPGMIVWDCGAYIGYYSAVFRKCLGNEGAVYTFEASSKNYDIVKQLPELNNWGNVFVINCAVGPDHTTIKFANNLGGSNGPVGLSKNYIENLEVEEVECCGVDELVFEKNIPVPDFIKFDLESAEEFALHNGDKVFKTKKSIILLELHGEKALEAAGLFLEKYNYHAVLVWDMPTPKVLYKNLSDFKKLGFIPHMVLCKPN